jgi:L-alanine-DL-glutamate epimerase-like enolase superfamily enzyme
MGHFELVTATVRCDEGEQGLGYTYTVGAGGAAIRALVDRDIKPILIGADPRRTEQLWQQMWWALHYVGRGGIASFAISAIDIALWDLKATLAGEPLWRFLGGNSPYVKAYAGGIDLQIPLDELRERTRRNLERGFRAIKMKLGRERLADDIARVKAVREVVGPDIPLMVDANMRWTVEQAIRASRALAEFDLYWLEEPIIPDDVEGHARIAREGSLPIATGENLHTIYEFQRLIAFGAVSFPEPDLTNIGGVTAWMKVAHLAEAHNLAVTTHGVHDLHLHLLAAVPNASYLEVHGFGLESFLQHPLEIRDGEAKAPDRPGHGVEFNWEALEPHEVSKTFAAAK